MEVAATLPELSGWTLIVYCTAALPSLLDDLSYITFLFLE